MGPFPLPGAGPLALVQVPWGCRVTRSRWLCPPVPPQRNDCPQPGGRLAMAGRVPAHAGRVGRPMPGGVGGRGRTVRSRVGGRGCRLSGGWWGEPQPGGVGGCRVAARSQPGGIAGSRAGRCPQPGGAGAANDLPTARQPVRQSVRQSAGRAGGAGAVPCPWPGWWPWPGGLVALGSAAAAAVAVGHLASGVTLSGPFSASPFSFLRRFSSVRDRGPGAGIGGIPWTVAPGATFGS